MNIMATTKLQQLIDRVGGDAGNLLTIDEAAFIRGCTGSAVRQIIVAKGFHRHLLGDMILVDRREFDSLPPRKVINGNVLRK